MTPAEHAGPDVAPDVAATDGPVVARGREAVVTDAGPGLVRRRYLDGRDTTVEVALHRHVAAHGYPVPALHEQEPGGMVMDRVDGPTLLEAYVAGTLDAAAVAAVLADLHARLHALPPPLGTAAGDRVLHLDLHPANVLLGADGPVVVDWASGRTGDPTLDLGHTAIVLAEAAVAGVDGAAGDVADVAVSRTHLHALLLAFLAAVAAQDPLARLDDVVARRLRDGMPPDTVQAAARLLRDLASGAVDAAPGTVA